MGKKLSVSNRNSGKSVGHLLPAVLNHRKAKLIVLRNTASSGP
jgi:hypothetical protein